MKLFAAALALTLSLVGCGPVDGDPIRSGAAASDSAPRQDAVTVAQLRRSRPSRTAALPWCSIWAVSRSAPPMWTLRWTACRNSRGSLLRTSRQTTGSQHRAAGGSCTASLLCAGRIRFFVYEKQDPQYPHQTGRELYCKQDGQPILLLCNSTPDTPDITAVVYCITGRTLDWSPRLSAGTSSPEPVEGVDDFSNHPASGAAS